MLQRIFIRCSSYFAALCLVCLAMTTAGAADIAGYLKDHPEQQRILPSDKSSVGYGIGQADCDRFINAVEQKEAGHDDGFYFALLTWRDGFITATNFSRANSADVLEPTISMNATVDWLLSYCVDHPGERFANAIQMLVRSLSAGETPGN